MPRKLNTDKIKAAFEDNPVLFMGVTAALLTGASKFITAVGQGYGQRTYAREVNRRVRKDNHR